MPSRSSAQLSFVSMGQTDAWIARETGIPRATVGFVRRGERELPTQYQTAMRALYQREAYSRMKDTGFSASQADRFRSYAPETVLKNMMDVSNKIEELARGLALLNKATDEESGISSPLSQYIEDARERVKHGMQNSRKPKEDWDAYGTEEGEEGETEEETTDREERDARVRRMLGYI